MTTQVPLRKLDVYRTDDGRCVEQFSKVKDILCKQPPGQESLSEDIEFSPDNELFIGVAQVMTNVGPKDLKFEIPAESIEQAFDKFHEFAIVAFEELQERMQEHQSQQSGIVVPPPGTLDALKRVDKEAGKIII